MAASQLAADFRDFAFTKNVAIALGSIAFLALSLKTCASFRRYLMRRSCPPDIVVLHQFPRGYRIPSISPFVLKLETWLRMAEIKYQNSHGYTFGPKGKLPYITYNGKDIADSQLIIEYLGTEMGKDLSVGHSEMGLALARAYFKMAEESLFWVTLLSRFFLEPNRRFMGVAWPTFWYIRHMYKDRTKDQGYGRHTKEEVLSIGKKDLKSLDVFLRGKRFLLGDKPCNEDAAVFGIVAQFVYTDSGTLNKFINNECPNLLAYVENMKDTYWPDWTECILRKNANKDY